MDEYSTILAAIQRDERYLRNLDWGVPRPGHPEGTVRAHIAELEQNLQQLHPHLTASEVWKLELLIHTHDTFKGGAEPSVAIDHPGSHSSLARRFLEEFCPDEDLLAMVQWHDEPFALWRQFSTRGRYNAQRLAALLERINDWSLFLTFQCIDGCTSGKSRKPLRWFLELTGDRVSRSIPGKRLLEGASDSPSTPDETGSRRDSQGD
ncbi:MAG: hypothetical protein KDA75_22355 [Planctomycetaceae bacterium]|nr:hypothetical protein [Planctomycetaceae bacterium]